MPVAEGGLLWASVAAVEAAGGFGAGWNGWVLSEGLSSRQITTANTLNKIQILGRQRIRVIIQTYLPENYETRISEPKRRQGRRNAPSLPRRLR